MLPGRTIEEDTYAIQETALRLRKILSIVVLLGLVAGLAYVARARGLDRMLLQGTRLGAPPSEVATQWKTEEEWLAGEVARDIAEMAFYARHRRVPAAGEASAQAKVTGAPGVSPIRITLTNKGMPDATVDLPLAFIWGPGEYVPVARLAAERMGLAAATPDAGSGADSSLVALTEPTLGILETENQRVSAMLTARPQDPAAHESAALVLAALALREAAGLSHDVRPALCRMTAHLALADTWGGGEPTADGRIARAALLVLAQRGGEAESAASRLPSERPGDRAWREALLIHVTDDWRRLAEPRKATLIERMAQLRASMRAADSSAVLEHLSAFATDEADYAELARLAMSDSTRLSVQAGNLLLPIGLATEEKGLAQIHSMVQGAPPGIGLGLALAPVPERTITAAGPRVIGWGTWSAYFQRHLLHQMTLDEMHTRGMLAMPAEANVKGRAYDAQYGTLPHYSFLQDRRESHGGIRPTRFAESIAYTIEQPERVSAFHFFVTEDLAAREIIRRGPARRAAWFDPPLPRGTTLDLALRSQALGYEPKAAAVEALRLLSPRDPAVLVLVAAAHPPGAPIGDLEKRLGPRLDYDVAFLKSLADAVKEDRPQLRMLDERLCKAGGPTWCAPLGVLLVEEGQYAEAEPILRKYFDAMPDRVAASWYAPWLVRHYLDNGSPADARTVADEAESTGSGSGFRSRVALLERQGRFSEAEAVLKLIRERYGNDATADPPQQDDDDPLIAFYHRMANVRGDAAYAERFQKLAAATFPSGVEKLEPAALTPQSAAEGVAILTASSTTRRLGLKSGDVIVGVDGHRVRTFRQYQLARTFGEGPEMTLHVWRHPGFLEVKTRTWSRWLDTDLRTNVPGEPTTRG